MKCLIVSAHPLEHSLCSKFTDLVCSRLSELGHDLVLENLYQDKFNPVLSDAERQSYYGNHYDTSKVKQHVQHLVAADAIVLLFPTWWFGFPAVLKGWFDRVWGPGIAYDHASDYGPIKPKLKKLKKFLVVTTLGAPWWVDIFIMRKPLKRILQSALLRACTKGCKLKYISFYKCEKVDQNRLNSFIHKIQSELNKWTI